MKSLHKSIKKLNKKQDVAVQQGANLQLSFDFEASKAEARHGTTTQQLSDMVCSQDETARQMLEERRAARLRREEEARRREEQPPVERGPRLRPSGLSPLSLSALGMMTT